MDNKEKKKPGRPRKNPVKLPKQKHGISNKPYEPSHAMEFLCDKPLTFKKIWHFFKLMAVNTIFMSFHKKNIYMWCQDHLQQSDIRVKIDCDEVVHYYNKVDLEIGLYCKNQELVMNTIDKNCVEIAFSSVESDSQDNIHVVLRDELEIEAAYQIDVCPYIKMVDDEKFNDENYALKFKLPCKYFKKMISDIKSFSDQVTIKKDGPQEPLLLEYITSDKKVKATHAVKNDKLLDLKQTLGEDDTFQASFNIDNIKPISSAVLSENISIYADENKPLMFTVDLDDSAVEIKILTKIIDDRLV